jgi:SAM-dependent methyltransferase
MTAHDTQPLSQSQRPVFVIRAARALRRLIVDRQYRDLIWLRLWRPKGAFQPFNETWLDRYPTIFSFVESELGRDSEVTILSYGCSTGEEVFSLRHYFPRAIIKGIDINPSNIAICRQHLKHTRDAAISFETASSTSAEPAVQYNAIFCMAVLRHGDLGLPGVTRCDHLIRFEDFAQAVEGFRRCLKPGGLLVIRYSNFRLCDAPAGAQFETILRVKHPDGAKKIPIFGPDNQLIEAVDYPDTVFRKK